MKNLVDLLDVTFPCGSRAKFSSGDIAYVCTECKGVWGTTSMPESCRDEVHKWEEIQALGGAGWDFFQNLEEYRKDSGAENEISQG